MFAVSNFSYLCPYSRRRTAKPDWLRVTAADKRRYRTSLHIVSSRHVASVARDLHVGGPVGSSARLSAGNGRGRNALTGGCSCGQETAFSTSGARARHKTKLCTTARGERMGDELTERTTREREKESDGGCDLVDDGARNWSRE